MTKESRMKAGKSISESMKKVEKIACPHCSVVSSPGNMKRWHGDNCKFNPQNSHKQ